MSNHNGGFVLEVLTCLLKTRVLISLSIINFMSINLAVAQNQCAAALSEAGKMYETGRFTPAIALLSSCLPDGIPKSERVASSRLLALSYLAEDFSDEAEEAVEKLLKLGRSYQTNSDIDPAPFIALVKKVKQRRGEPIIKRIKLNLGYPLLFLSDNSDVYKGGLIRGFDLMLGKRRFFMGCSYDYFSFSVTGRFYSLSFMYGAHHSTPNRKIAPFGQLRIGAVKRTIDFEDDRLNDINDNKFAYSLAAGIDISINSYRCSFVSFNYGKTYLTGQLGVMICF